MSEETPYPIGTPGVPWGDAEKKEWLAAERYEVGRDSGKSIPISSYIIYNTRTHILL